MSTRRMSLFSNENTCAILARYQLTEDVLCCWYIFTCYYNREIYLIGNTSIRYKFSHGKISYSFCFMNRNCVWIYYVCIINIENSIILTYITFSCYLACHKIFIKHTCMCYTILYHFEYQTVNMKLFIWLSENLRIFT